MTCLDTLSRPIDYLRISITDRCNLRCVYCMPAEGISGKLRHEDLLTYEELSRVVRAAADLGISKIRLTGGEPLVRLGVVELVSMIAKTPGIDDIAMTTNGVFLAQEAVHLKHAGLQRVNISLDTMSHAKFRSITRLGELDAVLAGIRAAERVGLHPIKINNVVMRGCNDDEIVDFARLTYRHPWHVRFIEFMPVGGTALKAIAEYVSVAAMRAVIEGACGPLASASSAGRGAGPARYYRLSGALGTIGFIAAISEHFCFGCNRLRLTADGRLRPCLMSDNEIDLRMALRSGADETVLQALLQQAIEHKPSGHHLDQGQIPLARQMAQIGG
jgi:GTP 3',8-cyclase